MIPQPSKQLSEPPPNKLACHAMQVVWHTGADQGLVIIKHFNEAGELISEAWLDPEDVYSYAQSLLEAYDHAVGIA